MSCTSPVSSSPPPRASRAPLSSSSYPSFCHLQCCTSAFIVTATVSYLLCFSIGRALGDLQKCPHLRLTSPSSKQHAQWNDMPKFMRSDPHSYSRTLARNGRSKLRAVMLARRSCQAWGARPTPRNENSHLRSDAWVWGLTFYMDALPWPNSNSDVL
eukprot:767122-Pyramimonas_sp.AAC.1